MTVVCIPGPLRPEVADRLPAAVEYLEWDGTGNYPDGLDRVEFLVGPYMGRPTPADALAAMTRLRVVQLLSAGYERWTGITPAGVILCNGRGVHGGSTAELAVGGIVSLIRDLPGFASAQQARQWHPARTASVAGSTVLVLGTGDIGRRIGTALAAFDAEVSYVGRTARAGVHALADLPALLPHAQVVVIALPLSPQTSELVDRDFLAALPDGAVLANIARGKVIDTEALRAELESGRLRAFLDVTDPEPLPADDPLWDAPGLLLTPHVGGGTLGWERRAVDLIVRQVTAFRDGTDLANVVER